MVQLFSVGCFTFDATNNTTPMKSNTTLVLILTFALFGSGSALVTAADAYASDDGKASLVMRAQTITLSEFKLDGVTFKEAVLALQKAAKLYDDKHRDVHFLFYKDVEAVASTAIKLDLKNVTLAEAMERLAQRAGVAVIAKDYAFLFYPKSDKP